MLGNQLQIVHRIHFKVTLFHMTPRWVCLSPISIVKMNKNVIVSLVLNPKFNLGAVVNRLAIIIHNFSREKNLKLYIFPYKIVNKKCIAQYFAVGD